MLLKDDCIGDWYLILEFLESTQHYEAYLSWKSPPTTTFLVQFLENGYTYKKQQLRVDTLLFVTESMLKA